jgi:cellulose synthase/poly-beta-1,6-N-acetylglucosamine synthase-like glycosyltransferase
MVTVQQHGTGSLTVGIYAHNEEGNISHILEQVLERQGLGEDTRIIVVCSGCTDSTVPVVQHYAVRDKRIELVIEPERLGVGSAINRVLERCTTDILVLIEADARLHEGAVRQLVNELQENEAGLVGAWPMIENESHGWIPRGLAFIRRVLLRCLFNLRSPADKTYSNSEFVCFRRRLVSRLPTHIVNVETYVDLCVHKSGYAVLPSRRARVLIRLPETVSDYIAQRRRIHYGHMQVKRFTGRYASSMEGIASRRPGLVFLSTVQELRIRPRLMLEMWPVLFLDLLAYFWACIDLMRQTNHVTWTMVSTTKW